MPFFIPGRMDLTALGIARTMNPQFPIRTRKLGGRAERDASAAPVSSPSDWNPRFVAYASAHGRSPDEQLEHDRSEYPSARAMPFMLWIQARWSEFDLARGVRPGGSHGPQEHAAFDAWLAAWRAA